MTQARRPLVALLVVVAAVLPSACSGSHHNPAKTTPAAAAAATVRTAECHDWNAAGASQRKRLVSGMRAFFGAQVDSPGTLGKALTDRQAFALFDGYCKQPYAAAFALYRIYGNAAAFTAPQK